MTDRSPSARILVLTNVDWSRMDARSFTAQSDPTKPMSFIEIAKRHDLPGSFREAFGVDYFRYRGELRRIGETCLRSVHDARLSLGFDDFDDWFYDDRDEFVFPIDDDDYYHPDLARTLDRVSDDSFLVLWDMAQTGFLQDRTVPAFERLVWPVLLPNNWAIRKSFLRRHFDAETSRHILSDHGFGQRCLVEFFGVSLDGMPAGRFEQFAPLMVPGVVQLAECYSVYLVHAGSLTYFSKLAERGSPLDLYRRLDLTLPFPFEECIRWAEPYLREVARVIPRLQARQF